MKMYRVADTGIGLRIVVQSLVKVRQAMVPATFRPNVILRITVDRKYICIVTSGSKVEC